MLKVEQETVFVSFLNNQNDLWGRVYLSGTAQPWNHTGRCNSRCNSRSVAPIFKWYLLFGRVIMANPASQRHDIIKRNAVWSNHEMVNYLKLRVCTINCALFKKCWVPLFPQKLKISYRCSWGTSEHSLGTVAPSTLNFIHLFTNSFA